MQSMSRGVINCAKQFLSHPFSRIKSFDQWAVDRDPVLTSTTSAKIGKTAIPRAKSRVIAVDIGINYIQPDFFSNGPAL